MDGLGLIPPFRLGLTGGIGSGKSTVARMLVERGAHLVDTDAIARSLTEPAGAAMPAIAAEFGPQAVADDGSLNRDHMRQRVFADAGVKARLEALLHPLIGQEAARQAALAGPRALVFDVPLLAESQGPRAWRHRVDRVLVVDCTVETQARRVAARPGWSLEAAQRVIAQQATRQSRRSVADAVVFNETLSLAELEAAVAQIWSAWTKAPHRA